MKVIKHYEHFLIKESENKTDTYSSYKECNPDDIIKNYKVIDITNNDVNYIENSIVTESDVITRTVVTWSIFNDSHILLHIYLIEEFDIMISKLEDDWFFVLLTIYVKQDKEWDENEFLDKEDWYFICDELDGVIDCLTKETNSLKRKRDKTNN